MSIVQINTILSGQVGLQPRRVTIISTDNLATVTTAGYLNSKNLQGYTLYSTDMVCMWYGYVSAASPGTFGIFNPTVTSVGLVTLVEWVNPSNVLLPVISGDLAVFNGTGGQISDSSILASNIVVKNAVNTMAAGSSIVLAKVNGTEASNAVTASGVAGVITTSALSTAAGGTYVITWTNTFISATSTVLLSVEGGTNTNQNINFTVVRSAGSAVLTIFNNAPVAALGGTIFIGYAVL